VGPRDELLERVERVLAVAEIVKASADDLEWLLRGRAPEQVALEWLAPGPAIVAITLGPEGVVGVPRDTGVLRRPGSAVDVADTVGAGDSFTSAFLAGLHAQLCWAPSSGSTSVPSMVARSGSCSTRPCSRPRSPAPDMGRSRRLRPS
jgi:fructokinase